MTAGWAVERARAPAAVLHAWDIPVPATRTVRVLEVSEPALVLGSTQPDDHVVDRAGIEVVRRRTGGGAVLLRPGEVVWVDVLVPAGDVLWVSDVGRAFHWLGETWAGALATLGIGGAAAHHGPLLRSGLSERVCFAGLGPGEVTLAGRKVVGMAQRRARAGALFQCAALLVWDPTELAARLGLEATALEPVAAGLSLRRADLEDGLLERLHSS